MVRKVCCDMLTLSHANTPHANEYRDARAHTDRPHVSRKLYLNITIIVVTINHGYLYVLLLDSLVLALPGNK